MWLDYRLGATFEGCNGAVWGVIRPKSGGGVQRLGWATFCWLLLIVVIAADGVLASFVDATVQLFHLSPPLPPLGEWGGGGGDGADVDCPERIESGTSR